MTEFNHSDNMKKFSDVRPLADILGQIDLDDYGYESPIKMIIGEFETAYSKKCIEVVQKYGFDVDEKELAKALNYDRNQYRKGYLNGFLAAKDKYQTSPGEWGKWVISEIRCPNCLEYFQTDCYSMGELDKCPICGADMKGGAE